MYKMDVRPMSVSDNDYLLKNQKKKQLNIYF